MVFIKNKKMTRGLAGILAILLTLSAAVCFTGCSESGREEKRKCLCGRTG